MPYNSRAISIACVRSEEALVLKAMIVDDEAPARSELKFLLDELGQT